ncbi:MAG: glutamate 5-kinase [Fibrobacterota bacterium]
MKNIISSAERIVIKLGTRVVIDKDGRFSSRNAERIAEAVEIARGRKKEIILVSSGAIGVALSELGIKNKPVDLPSKQALAAIGQKSLMHFYKNIFMKRGIITGQMLVTRADFSSRLPFINMRNTFNALLKYKAVPIINENDSLSTEEIRMGDNDNLAAHIANITNADLLIILTDIDGLYDRNPSAKDAEIVRVVDKINKNIFDMASGKGSSVSVGGMKTKIEAALNVTSAGCAAIIANGNSDDITAMLGGEARGTLFRPSEKRTSGKIRWMRLSSRPRGTIKINKGCFEALLKGRSILPVGITGIEGNFSRGDTVKIFFRKKIGRGLVNYSSSQLRKIKGKRTPEIKKSLGEKPYDEAVHRNNTFLIK